MHLDTAWHYKNAATTGQGIRRYLEETGKSRDAVFVTYKGGSIDDDPSVHRGMDEYLMQGLTEVRHHGRTRWS